VSSSALIYVGLVGGVSAAAWYAIRSGLSPGVALLAASVAAAAVIALGERLLPYRRAWLVPHGDLRTDVLHLIFTSLLAAGGRWFNVVAVSVAVSVLGVRPAASPSLWPASWPLVGQLALALVLQDLCAYWIHRAQHQIPLLWRFHAVHHSAPRLYWLNQMLNHPIDAMISGASMLPLAALGAPDVTLAVFGALTTAHLLLQHANIDYVLGPFDRLLSAAPAHRWHHSRRLAESNGNYGALLLTWDALFHSRIWPTDHPPPTDTGLADRPDYPQGYLGQLAAPFHSR
jgi:sterol desaturase/sphingolipid hydroxylase (fatty acid hydroxylase superfamily)